MMTREEIIKLIWDLYEEAKKDKAEIWDKATNPDADFMSVQKLHMYMGQCTICETLLASIGEIEVEDL